MNPEDEAGWDEGHLTVVRGKGIVSVQVAESKSARNLVKALATPGAK